MEFPSRAWLTGCVIRFPGKEGNVTNESGSKTASARSAAAAALLESMGAVQQALMRTPGVSPEQLAARLKEWQQLVIELDRGAAQGTELATL